MSVQNLLMSFASLVTFALVAAGTSASIGNLSVMV